MRRLLSRLLRAMGRAVRDPRHCVATMRTLLVRWVLRRPAVCRDRNGFRLVLLPEEPLHSLFYHGYLGFPEIGEQEFARRAIRPGMTVFDVGANIGQFTLLFASLVGPQGRVVAFEPCETTARRLMAHIALNGFGNVTVERLAANDRHGGSMILNVFPLGYSAWNTVGKPEMYARGSRSQRLKPVVQEEVPTVTIDGYCSEHNIERIDYLKVDVEGAELEAIMGVRELLEKKAVRYVQFEVSQDMIRGMSRNGDEVFVVLETLGYESHPVSRAGELLPPVRSSRAHFANFVAMPKGIGQR